MGRTVKRSISDVEFADRQIQEFRTKIKKNMIEEGYDELDEQEIKERLDEKLLEVAKQRTLNEQGDNRLHNDISHELSVE